MAITTQAGAVSGRRPRLRYGPAMAERARLFLPGMYALKEREKEREEQRRRAELELNLKRKEFREMRQAANRAENIQLASLGLQGGLTYAGLKGLGMLGTDVAPATATKIMGEGAATGAVQAPTATTASPTLTGGEALGSAGLGYGAGMVGRKFADDSLGTTTSSILSGAAAGGMYAGLPGAAIGAAGGLAGDPGTIRRIGKIPRYLEDIGERVEKLGDRTIDLVTHPTEAPGRLLRGAQGLGKDALDLPYKAGRAAERMGNFAEGVGEFAEDIGGAVEDLGDAVLDPIDSGCIAIGYMYGRNSRQWRYAQVFCGRHMNYQDLDGYYKVGAFFINLWNRFPRTKALGERFITRKFYHYMLHHLDRRKANIPLRVYGWLWMKTFKVAGKKHIKAHELPYGHCVGLKIGE